MVDPKRPTVVEAVIGRESELALLDAFLDRIASEGEALVVLGEAGVGKSVLLQATAAEASARGWRVLEVGGVEFDADVSYAGLGRVVLPLVGQLSELDPPHRAALATALGFVDGDPPARMVVSNAALALLALASTAAPLVVIVDDLPWLDRASAAVFGFVARRLTESRIGFLAGSRSDRGGFFERASLPELEVAPLHREPARTLLSNRFPSLTPRLRERVLDEGRGNPLALLEFAAVLSGGAGSTQSTLPAILPLDRRVQGLFGAQLTALPAATRRALLLAALHHRPDLGAVAGTSGLEALTAAAEEGLIALDERAQRLTFRHPLVRAAVVDLATAEEQRHAHRVLAECLADEPDVQAWHLAEAADQPDEQAAGLLEQTARRMLRRGDAVGAVTALVRAADLSPGAVERSRRLVHAAYVGRDVNRDLRKVTRLLDDARRADGQEAASMQAAVAAAWMVLTLDGSVDTAHRLLLGALEHQSHSTDPQVLEDALYTLMSVCHFSGRPELWHGFRSVLERRPSSVASVIDLFDRTFADPARTAVGALAEIDSAIERLTDEADATRIVRVSFAGMFVDRLPGCRRALRRVVDGAREDGTVASAIAASIFVGLDAFQTGRWDEAKQIVDDAVARCEEYGYALPKWGGCHVQALVAAARGDRDTMLRVTGEMIQWASPRQARAVEFNARHARCLAALGRRDAEGAYREAEAVSPPGQLAAFVPQALWLGMDLVQAAVLTERHVEAAAHVSAMRKAGITALSPRYALMVAGAAAIAAPEDEALPLFEDALGIPDIGRWPFDVARVQLAYGEHLRRVGSAGDAALQLSVALRELKRLGARPWTDRASSELRSTGRHPSTSAPLNPIELTRQELDIAALAATGLSNREIGEQLHLSHRSVSSHLHGIYPKLGIRSRAALRDALNARDVAHNSPDVD